MNDIRFSKKEKKRINNVLFKIRTGEIDLKNVERIQFWDEKEYTDESVVTVRKIFNHFLTQQLKGKEFPVDAVKPILRKVLNKERERLGFDIIEDSAEA